MRTNFLMIMKIANQYDKRSQTHIFKESYSVLKQKMFRAYCATNEQKKITLHDVQEKYHEAAKLSDEFLNQQVTSHVESFATKAESISGSKVQKLEQDVQTKINTLLRGEDGKSGIQAEVDAIKHAVGNLSETLNGKDGKDGIKSQVANLSEEMKDQTNKAKKFSNFLWWHRIELIGLSLSSPFFYEQWKNYLRAAPKQDFTKEKNKAIQERQLKVDELHKQLEETWSLPGRSVKENLRAERDQLLQEIKKLNDCLNQPERSIKSCLESKSENPESSELQQTTLSR